MSRLIIQSAAQTVPLTIQGLVGIPSKDIDLMSPDGKWKMSVPRDQFAVDIEPGQMMLVSLTLTRVAIAEDEAVLMKSPKLILPGKLDS